MTMVSLPPSNVPPSEIRVSFLRGVVGVLAIPCRYWRLWCLAGSKWMDWNFPGPPKLPQSCRYLVGIYHVKCTRYQRKTRSQLSDKMERWNAEKRRRKEKQPKKEDRKKIQARETLGTSPMWKNCTASRSQAPLEEKMSTWRLLWREAHVHVKIVKNEDFGPLLEE